MNHSTAVGAINTAMHAAYQGLPMPLLLVCEDNGIGISVKTPQRLGRADLRATATASSTSAPTAPTSPTRSTPPRLPPTWVRSHRGPRSCTCAPCG